MGLREPAGSLALAARVAEWQRTGIRPPVVVWTAARTAQSSTPFAATGCTPPIHSSRLMSALAAAELVGRKRAGRDDVQLVACGRP
jgi:hypothetical protein